MKPSTQQFAAAIDLMRRLPAEDRLARDSAVTYLTSLSSAPLCPDLTRLLSYLFIQEDAELLWVAFGFEGSCAFKAAPSVRRVRIQPHAGLAALGLV